jgi:nucleolar GTP-binding protein
MEVDVPKPKKKLERELELELGDDYILDLKKHYMLPENEKYDRVPEIWQGHNIADYIDPDIMEKLEKLEEEEGLREQAGMYDDEADQDDEEAKELRQKAAEVRKQHLIIMKESHERRSSTKPKMPREGRKRERSLSRMDSELGRLGIPISPARMRNLSRSMSRPPAKKLRTLSASERNRSRSKSVPARDEQGVKNETARIKVKKMAKKAQKPKNRDARKGEGDRHIFDMKPKHLFTGKRGIGKTDRR